MLKSINCIKKKITILLIVIMLLISSMVRSQQLDNYLIPIQTLNTYQILGLTKDTSHTKNTFEISKLITLKLYNQYLSYIKASEDKHFYKQQLPDTSVVIVHNVNKYLKDKDLQDQPIVAISWENALNFCKWKTLQDNKSGEIEFIYRLPYCSEWLFAQHFLEKSGIENDFNKFYSDWLINTKDESYFFYSPNSTFDYSYFASEDDPSVLKRKVIIGNSFLFKLPKFIDFFALSYYSYIGYSHTGFRCIKVYLTDSILADKNSTENRLIKMWNLTTYKTTTRKSFNTYLADNTFIEYQLRNNLFDGYYISKYPNGKIKTTGYFTNNMKVGIWSICDSLGNLKNQRFYINSYIYQTIFPKFTEVKTTKYISNNKYV